MSELPQENLRVRAQVWRLLGRIFLAEPDPELLAALRLDETWEIFSALAPGTDVARLRPLVQSEAFSMEAVRLEFHRLFSAPSGPYVFPYESCYSVAEPPGPLMGPAAISVVKAYAAAGFEITSELLEAPDHLGVEFRFVAEVFDQEAQASEDGNAAVAERFASLRSGFCQQHLQTWAGKVADRISASGVSAFYSGFSALARGIVARES